MSHSQDVPLSDLRVISLPEQQLFDEISAETTDFTCVLWDLENEPEGCAREDVDIAVAPYYSGRWLKDPSVVRDVSLVQLQSTGFDGVPEKIGEDVALAAGGWVHAAGTAEIALGLIIAAQRNLDRAVLQQHEGVYKRYFSRAVADSRVTVVGVGKIGGAVISRLAPFEVELTRVASHAREDEAGRIHGIDELDEILPRTDILVLALPLGDATRDLVGERTLALLPDDALVVNVGRGPVVNTDALTAAAESGTRCSRFIFMRSAGTTQSARSRSISAHVAPRTSPDRAAVNAANSSARAPKPSRLRNSAIQRGISSSDRGTLDVSYQQSDGEIRGYFQLADPGAASSAAQDATADSGGQ